MLVLLLRNLIEKEGVKEGRSEEKNTRNDDRP
jgi:hypothetical protein